TAASGTAAPPAARPPGHGVWTGCGGPEPGRCCSCAPQSPSHGPWRGNARLAGRSLRRSAQGGRRAADDRAMVPPSDADLLVEPAQPEAAPVDDRPTDDEHRFLRTSEVAALFQVSERAVTDWAARGRL